MYWGPWPELPVLSGEKEVTSKEQIFLRGKEMIVRGEGGKGNGRKAGKGGKWSWWKNATLKRN